MVSIFKAPGTSKLKPGAPSFIVDQQPVFYRDRDRRYPLVMANI